ncbi:MAG TPA: cytochrome c [Terriglobales bacterium]|nr:cytochrome c [Terriglobales bacterium]
METRLRSVSPSLTLVLLIALFLGCNSTSTQRSRPLTIQEQHGREIFQAHCAICHNAYRKEPLQGPPLVGVFRKKELPSGIPATDEHVRETILTGRRNMPPFTALLDERQLNELLAYLHAL